MSSIVFIDTICMTAKEYQSEVFEMFTNKFPDLEARREWPAFVGVKGQYSPRVDIAVGPFSVTPNQNQARNYDRLFQRYRSFLKDVHDIHRANFASDDIIEYTFTPFNRINRLNYNARCFLSIEIESQNSKKHMMGSIINAASLGRIGIGIAYNDSAFRTFKRILNYLAFLKRVEKNTYNTSNFLLLSKDQFFDLLEDQ